MRQQVTRPESESQQWDSKGRENQNRQQSGTSRTGALKSRAEVKEKKAFKI